MNYYWQPQQTAYASYSIVYQDFDDEHATDSNNYVVHEPAIGVNLSLGPHTELGVEVGYFRQDVNNENGEDGFVEFTSYENDAYKMAGLSHGDEDTHFGDIDYAIYLKNDGQFSILESGNQKGSFGAYAAGDVFRVEVVNDEVRYYKNGSVVYESATTPDYPLLLDASIYSVGGTIVDASLEWI